MIHDDLALALTRAPIAAAIAAAAHVGRGDERAADQAAAAAMRSALEDMAISARVVIGAGDASEATGLDAGARLGAGGGASLDIAVRPIEGTTLAVKAAAGALSVLAAAPSGRLFAAPPLYMDKIAIGPGYPAGVVSLDRSAEANVRALAEAKGVATEEIGVCVLDRPRHAGAIESLRRAGARVQLIGDGDVAAVINCAKPGAGIDMYLGQGGAAEGVLAAAALRCVGGQFQGRLIARSSADKDRAARSGISDFDRVYGLNELVGDDVVFCAVGITRGSLLDRVCVGAGSAEAHAIAFNSATGSEWSLKLRRPLPST